MDGNENKKEKIMEQFKRRSLTKDWTDFLHFFHSTPFGFCASQGLPMAMLVLEEGTRGVPTASLECAEEKKLSSVSASTGPARMESEG